MILSEQELVRRKAKEELEKLGINPYPAERYEMTTTTAKIKANFDTQPEDFTEVSLAGRLMSRRIMGSASFAELQDAEGRVQVYFRRDDLCPEEDKTLYNTVFKRLLDIGDIIGHGLDD